MEPLKKVTGSIWKAFTWLEQYLLVTAYVLIPVLIVVEVISRYLMKSAVIGIEESCLFIVAYVYYIGAAYAVKREDHITVKVLHLLPLSPKLLLWIRYTASILSLLCASAITWYLTDYFLYVYKSPSLFTPFTFRKVYYMAGPTIGWILIFLYSITNLFKIKSQLNNGDEIEC